MGLFGKLFKDSFGEWMKNASFEELEAAYEERRKKWLKKEARTTGEKTYEMKRLDAEIGRRAAEKWKNDPRRSKDPNYRWTDANRGDKD